MRRSQVLNLVVMATGLVVLIGWATGTQLLTRLVPGLIAMKANTALGFVLFGLAGFLSVNPNPAVRRIALLAASVGGLLGILTLGQVVFGWNLGIDQLLFADTIDPTGTASPGRMAPLTALCFSLLGLVVVLNKRLPTLPRQLIIISVLAIAISGVVSYPFSLLTAGGVFSVSGMALNTAILFILLAIAVILEQATFDWMTVLLSRSPLGEATRRLLVTATLVPFLLAWLIFAGEGAGFFDASVARLYYSISAMLLLGVLVLFNAQRLASVESSNKLLQSDFASVQNQLQSFVDNTPAAIFIKDVDGSYQLVNDRFEKLVGKPRSAILGRSAPSIFPSSILAKVVGSDQQVKDTKAVVATEISMDVQGKRLTYLNTKFPIFDQNGEIRAIGGMWTDVTEQYNLAESLNAKNVDLERSNKELEQFAYVASHDLQEPLRMVSSYMQLLESRYKDRLDSDASEFIGYAVDGAERMQRLIQDLLAFSRIGTKGKVPEPVSSEEALAAALKNLQIRLEESKAQVNHQPLPVVVADKNQLAQVFQNLLGNAMKFSGEDSPRIDIGVKKAGNFAEFSVRDHGIGFEPRHADRIFVLFQRLNSRELYEGTGIGLAICKKIVERHGGRIWAESQPGKGATFHFTFPLVPDVLPVEADEPAVPDAVAPQETVEQRAERLI